MEQKIEQIFGDRNSTITRDLKLNLTKLLTDGALAKEEALLVLLATGESVKSKALTSLAREELAAFDFTKEQLDEAKESAAIMAMLNMYYRFRHMVHKPDDYKTAGLRMTSLAKPQLGKERFELLAFAVSVLNGCETCIGSHEEVLRKAGFSVEKIHDAAKLAAVVKATETLIQ